MYTFVDETNIYTQMKERDSRIETLKMLISSKEMSSQEELLKALSAEGFHITQATLSRDLKQLKVAKAATMNGKYIYVLPNETMYRRRPSPPSQQTIRITIHSATRLRRGATAILVCTPLIPVFMVLVGRMTQSYAEGRLAAMQRLGDQLLDLLAGLTTLKALGREASPKRRVRELGDDYAAKTMNTLYVAFLSGAVLEFLATLSTALVAVEVGLRLANGDVSLFTGLTIIMLTPEALRPLREVGSQFHASSDGVSAARATFEILDGAARTSADGAEAPDLSSAVIEFRDVCVQAPGRATVAPSHLSARIEPGKVTVLRGPSGSGKSTAVSTLLGLLEPTGGRVTVGGVPMDAIDREALWRQISWVPQRPAIVPGTVLENVGFPPGPELRRAAALTGFDEVVARMPNGWDSRLGHAGVGLSVGQRQRLALTRALVAARPLVLLDEPSAHLDAISERHVSAAVRELADTGHTVVVVAHRNALIGEADAVVEVGAAAGGAAS